MFRADGEVLTYAQNGKSLEKRKSRRVFGIREFPVDKVPRRHTKIECRVRIDRIRLYTFEISFELCEEIASRLECKNALHFEDSDGSSVDARR